MACGVTLKRAIDLDALHSPDHSGIKRRRTSNVCGHQSPYQPAASGFASQQQQHQQNYHFGGQGSPQGQSSHFVQQDKTPIIFDTVAFNAKVSSDELYSFLRKELHLLGKRRAPEGAELGVSCSSNDQQSYVRGADSPLSDSSSSDNEQQHQQHQKRANQSCMDYCSNYNHNVSSTQHLNIINSNNNNNNPNPQHSSQQDGSMVPSTSKISLRDRPLFSFTQVRNICERLLKEQESRLSVEYDKVLNAKLAEQHEAFVRFTYDQIHRRFEDAPMSYLS